ncbi:MAG: HAD-IIIA family hydrolase [bacterium]|nr:HAD-IIIA family hydrolase [bacterium]
MFYPKTGEREAPMYPEDVRLIAGAAQAARHVSEAGFLLILVSNQGAYAKGKVPLRSLWLCHERFVELMEAEGVPLDGVFYSFSHPEGKVPFFSGLSLERKPNPYLLLTATAQFQIDLASSWMVGDRETDVECGRAAGTRTARILAAETKGKAPSKADIIVSGLEEAAERILEFGRARD